MPKKFDTNPLDPTFPERMREAETAVLPKNDYATAEFPPANEEETRRFENTDFNNSQSPFNGRQIPANYQPAQFAEMNRSSNRKVAKIGLPENIMTVLPYLPFWIGLAAGIIILFLVPKNESKVRFHAAQGVAAHIGILLVTFILEGVSHIPGFGMAAVGGTIFTVVTTIMLIIFAFKAFRGKPVHIESVDALTEWFEEKIQPRN